MKETVERNGRFYTNEKGEIKTENEQLKEWLLIANKHNEELQRERDMYKGSFETMSTNYFRLENIIKEVREYIEKNKASLPMGRDDFTCEMRYSDPVVLASKLLEILDKENNNE